MKTPNIFDITVGSGTCEGSHPQGGPCDEPLILCAECGSTHALEDECIDEPHSIHVCGVCGTQIHWVKNVESAERRHAQSPSDALGKEMLRKLNIAYFQSAKDLKRWQAFVLLITRSQIKDTIDECSKGKYKYGALNHILNKLAWLIDNDKVEEAYTQDPNSEELVP